MPPVIPFQPQAVTPPGQPPVGSSPATQPVPNSGQQAAGMARLAVIVRMMEETIPMLGAGSEAGRDLLSSTSRLAKHVSSGSGSPGVENAALMNAVARQRQNAAMMAQANAQRMGQPGAQPQTPAPEPQPAAA